MQLTSPAFEAGASIPARYTCEGQDISPPLAWSGLPATTQSLALTCEDPDAPETWLHWLLFNLPAELTHLPEKFPKRGRQTNGACQGLNDFKEIGYGGPCPPGGGSHRYFFTLYALDEPLALKPGITFLAFAEAIQGHVLAQASLMGRFK